MPFRITRGAGMANDQVALAQVEAAQLGLAHVDIVFANAVTSAAQKTDTLIHNFEDAATDLLAFFSAFSLT